jgi:hypothetical protein
LVIIVTTWRLEISSRRFWISGSENGAVPRWLPEVGDALDPGPPHRSPQLRLGSTP